MSWVFGIGQARLDLVNVDAKGSQSFDSGFRVRRPGLPVAALVVMLLVQFFLEAFSTRLRRQVGSV